RVRATTADPDEQNNHTAFAVSRVPEGVDPVDPVADLVLVTSDGNTGFGIVGGESLVLQLVISNNGSSRAQDAILHLGLPEGISIADANGCTASGTSGEVACGEIGDLPAGDNKTIEIALATTVVEQKTVQQLTVLVQST